MTTPSRSPRPTIALFLALALSAGARAQAVNPPPSATDDPAAAPDKAVVLSPFEVVSENKGYFAPNTMSGTRFNTKLEDLASAMTVVTKEQMSDFAMLDVNDIFLYTASAEGTGTFTDLNVDRNGSIADNVALNPTQANRIRGIAPANISLGNFETMGRVPVDPIAVDAVEISRGPNSSVFGLGNPSGTVNQVAAAANVSRDRSQVQFRGDSYDGYRTSLDLNRVLVPGKLAVRGTGVFQHDGFVRKPSGVDTERYKGMVKYTPFRGTSITAGVEYYHSYGVRANFTPPRDNISYWEQSGRPTWDPVAQVIHVNGSTIGPITAATFPATFNGTNIDYFNNSTSIVASGIQFIDQKGLGYWSAPTTFATIANGPLGTTQTERFLQTSAATGVAGGKPGAQPLFTTTPTVSDKSIYDWSSVNIAAINRDWDRVITSTFQVEQHFFTTARQTLDGQVAFMREDAQRYRRDYIGSQNSQGQSGQLFVDANEKLLDGTTNPYFLRPYIGEGEPATEQDPSKWDSYRAQLAYKLDFTKDHGLLKWLGMHQLSGYDEYKYRISRRRSYRDGVLDGHGWTNVVQNATNTTLNNNPNIARAFLRYYVGDANGSNIDYGPTDYTTGVYNFNYGSYPASPNPPVAGSGSFKNEPSLFGLAASSTNTGGVSDTKTILKALGWVLQDHFLDDRIVTTFGVREDKQYVKNGYTGTGVNTSQVVNPDGTTFNYDVINHWAPGDYKYGAGKTKQAGAVVRPFRGLPFVDALGHSGGASTFLADTLNGLSLTYNKSSSFKPQDPKVNVYLQPLPNPSGSGRDWGFWLSMADNKFVLRFNRWDNKSLNKSGGDAGTIAQRAVREDIPNTSNQAYILNTQATAWVTALNPTWSQDQIATEVARQTGISTTQLAGLISQFNNISSTQDITAKGTEIELNYNPTKFWTVSGSVTDTQSINSNVSSELDKYISERYKIWTTIIDQRTGLPWWTTNYGGSQTAQQNYTAYLDSPLHVIRQLEGQSNPQLRRYAARVSSNYRLSGITENPLLKNVSVGGAIRWEDRGAIGYYGVQKLPAIITDLNTNNPIYDKSNLGGGVRGNYYFDAFVGYRRRMFNNKIGANFQLNVRNIQESGHLQAIAAFPDGTPSAYRIVDPRQFILSATFDL